MIVDIPVFLFDRTGHVRVEIQVLTSKTLSEQRFSTVPEWVLDAEIAGAALRRRWTCT